MVKSDEIKIKKETIFYLQTVNIKNILFILESLLITSMEAPGWERFVFKHFMSGQLDATIAMAYMEEYGIGLNTLTASCSEQLAREDPSRMKEIIDLHSSIINKIEEYNEEKDQNESDIRRHLGRHHLIVPLVDISSAEKKHKDDIRIMKKVYDKYKEAFDNLDEVYGWKKHPLKVMTHRKMGNPIIKAQCKCCGVTYAFIASSLYFEDDVDESVYTGQICYHCEKKILGTVERKSKCDLMKDNVRTMRDAMQTYKDAVELDPKRRKIEK
jgi:hypothetical protein